MIKSSTFSLERVITDHLESFFEAHGNLIPTKGLYQRVMRAVEKPLLLKTLEMAQGNQAKAASILGIHRNTLRKKIQDIQIENKNR